MLQALCQNCGKSSTWLPPRRWSNRGITMAFIDLLRRDGWLVRVGFPVYCSEDCAADAALDITPKDKKTPAPIGGTGRGLGPQRSGVRAAACQPNMPAG